MKKIIAIILTFAALFAIVGLFGACGKGGDKAKEASVRYLGGQSLLAGNTDPKTFFENVNDTVDPQKIYNSIEYKEDMLYGVYTLNNQEKDIKKVRKDIPMEKVQFSESSYKFSVLPIAVYSGRDYIAKTASTYKYGDYENITDKDVAVLEFATEDKKGNMVCVYEVSGNKIKYTQIEQTSSDGEPFAYETGNVVFEYDFSISGPYLTLTKGKNSIELKSYCLTENSDDELWLSGYSLQNSPLVDELDYFATGTFNYAAKRDGSYYDMSAYKLADDGRITLYLADKDADGKMHKFVKQYAYILQSEGGSFLNNCSIILLDGEKTYYYTDSITAREARIMKDDGEDTSALSEEDVKEIAEKKKDLFDDLYNEFQSNGIGVTINQVTGEIAMDSSVLFGGDSAEITEDGKALLNKFLNAYTSIIYNDKYDGFISKTKIEGHIAPVAGSTYESGLQLSQERADNVKNYCLSANSNADIGRLTANLESVGMSNSKPIYDADGNVDMAACRRVSFRFLVNIDK